MGRTSSISMPSMVGTWVRPPLSACQVWWGPGSDLLYQHAKYGGDLGRVPAVDKKCDVFCLFFCHALE